MVHLCFLDAFYAAVTVTKVVEAHREPTPPAVRPRHLGEGQRLADLPLVP